MRRWSFISGLTVILVLLLGLSGFCVWATRGLTAEVESIISGNYDTIRSVRELRSDITRINARYLSSRVVEKMPASRMPFEIEAARIYERFASIQRQSSQTPNAEPCNRLKLLLEDYFSNYQKVFLLSSAEGERYAQLIRELARASEDISEVADVIVEANENAIFARREGAISRGRLFGWAALGIAVVSLGIYLLTSIHLTRAFFVPLRQLRDSIVKVGHRQFDVSVPVQGSDELAQIAQTFNVMAAELRAYVEESDLRVVEANRVSRAILEALPYPIYIVDGDFKVKLKNPRAAALNAALKISGQLPGAVRKCIDNAAALGTELIGDDLHQAVEIPLPDATTGQASTYLPQVFRMASAPGVSAGWAVLLMDVTRLRQFDLAKSKAISTLGHEVKTPVTSIRMTLHLLLEEKIGALTEDQRELVAAGRDDCERLLLVLNSLLELARYEGGCVEMKLVPTAPAALLFQAEGMHSSYFRGSTPLLVAEPAPDRLPWVLADGIHVVRVLGNYLSNAAKYRTPGTPVTLSAETRADGFVRFSVRNQTQRPLSEVEQARVFDPFYRCAGEGAEGTGLGLTICREIAIAHGGRVGVWSSGETIEFYLDLRQSPPSAIGKQAVPAAENLVAH